MNNEKKVVKIDNEMIDKRSIAIKNREIEMTMCIGGYHEIGECTLADPYGLNSFLEDMKNSIHLGCTMQQRDGLANCATYDIYYTNQNVLADRPFSTCRNHLITTKTTNATARYIAQNGLNFRISHPCCAKIDYINYLPGRNILLLPDFLGEDNGYNQRLHEIVRFLNRYGGDLKSLFVLVGGRISDITIGADPEFELYSLSGEYVLPASGYFEFNGSIGTDGNPSTLELRPKPASNEVKFVKHVNSLMQRLITKFKLSIKGDMLPLGGHIHVGGISYDGSIIALLDDFIGSKVINLSGNKRGDYKRLGEYRRKDYGFEYRTPPSAIYYNPQLLRIVFKLLLAILHKGRSEEGITYYYPVRPNELLKYLSHQEVTYFYRMMRFLKGRIKSPKEKIFINWPIQSRYSTNFDGNWNSNIKSELNELMKRELKVGRYRLVSAGILFNIGVNGEPKSAAGGDYILVPAHFANDTFQFNKVKDKFIDALKKNVIVGGDNVQY